MVKVKIARRCSTITDSPGGCEIVIPARRNFFIIAFLGFWLMGWAFGEVFAIRQLFFAEKDQHIPNFFLFAWLGGWTVGGAFAVYTWLWTVSGKERILLKPATLSIKRDVLGFGRTREFDLNHVAGLRVSAQTHNPLDTGYGMRFWGIGGGWIAFDYGAKTYRFGAAVDEAEAREIVSELGRRHNFQ